MKVDWAWMLIFALAVIVGKLAYDNRLKKSTTASLTTMTTQVEHKEPSTIEEYLAKHYPNAQ